MRKVMIVLSTLFLGMSVPNCNGTQVLQQQLDQLQAKQAQEGAKMQTMESNLTKANMELEQVKSILQQMSNTVLAQKQAIDQLEAALKAKAAAKTPAATVKKKKH